MPMHHASASGHDRSDSRTVYDRKWKVYHHYDLSFSYIFVCVYDRVHRIGLLTNYGRQNCFDHAGACGENTSEIWSVPVATEFLIFTLQLLQFMFIKLCPMLDFLIDLIFVCSDPTERPRRWGSPSIMALYITPGPMAVDRAKYPPSFVASLCIRNVRVVNVNYSFLIHHYKPVKQRDKLVTQDKLGVILSCVVGGLGSGLFLDLKWIGPSEGKVPQFRVMTAYG
ncbi:hypothetical protein PIB30_066953 [Stylosanthes scabra]|uniref:Uncharacterized protein n=1 Tax=Stylosanthes scabra TaxID=79078 RepID=A0ABU6SMV7_9FABA|nr:hypothetical protein [Stylosanthes scabra]